MIDFNTISSLYEAQENNSYAVTGAGIVLGGMTLYLYTTINTIAFVALGCLSVAIIGMGGLGLYCNYQMQHLHDQANAAGSSPANEAALNTLISELTDQLEETSGRLKRSIKLTNRLVKERDAALKTRKAEDQVAVK